MAEHYTKNTVEVSAWCAKCGRRTIHRVDRDSAQGRLGPCLECIAVLDREAETRAVEDYAYEERAAILEFEAGLDRAEAEQRAREEYPVKGQRGLGF